MRKFNLPLAKEILAKIEAEPDAFDMRRWTEFDRTTEEVSVEQALDPQNLCHTSHCLAGWAITLSGNPLVDLGETRFNDPLYWTGVIRMGTVTDSGIKWKEITSTDNHDYDLDAPQSDVILIAAKRLGLKPKKAREVFLRKDNDGALRWLKKKIEKETKNQAERS